MNPDLAPLSAKQWLTKLHSGEVRSRDALEYFIARVEQYNAQLNAIIATDFSGARRQADAADAAFAKGEKWGVLHGLPMTIKDTYEVVGMPATAGSPKLSSHYPKQNGVVPQKLIDAGAIIFGKTNVPLFGSDMQSYNKVYGTTNNPWDLSRTPGGSSGGAAAALAAGLTPIEMGSDIGGSIRTPAHYCGVFGHKSTHGIISLRGHIPGPPGTISEPDLAVAGPLATTADDLQLLLDVTAGPSPSHSEGWQLKLPESRINTLQNARVLVWINDPLCTLDYGIQALYENCVEQLRNAGAIITIGSPLNKSLSEFYDLYLNLLGGVMGGGYKKSQRQVMYYATPLFQKISDRFKLPPHFDNFLLGVGQSHIEWNRHNEKRCRLSNKVASIFNQYDVVLMPITPTAAIKHQHKPDMPLRKIEVNHIKRSYTEQLMWISPATLMGMPATSMPIGNTKEGLPVNIQVMSGAYQDKTTIGFASLLDKIINGRTGLPKGYD